MECAAAYDAAEADELCLLDITATWEERGTAIRTVGRVAEAVDRPLHRRRRGALGRRHGPSAAGRRRQGLGEQRRGGKAELLAEAGGRFGSQCLVLAVDARRSAGGGFEVVVAGGRIPTGLDALEWIRRAEGLGAGEILLTSMDRDGTGDGYDLELVGRASDAVSVPVIASGGAGRLEHLAAVFERTGASAALAASIFHRRIHTVAEAKRYLSVRGIPIRPPQAELFAAAG